MIQRVLDKRSATRAMLLGLGYDRLRHECKRYITQGYIPINEYEDLVKYLYDPYIALGGNGTAKALMEKVMELPNAKET